LGGESNISALYKSENIIIDIRAENENDALDIFEEIIKDNTKHEVIEIKDLGYNG